MWDERKLLLGMQKQRNTGTSTASTQLNDITWLPWKGEHFIGLKGWDSAILTLVKKTMFLHLKFIEATY